MRMHSILVLDPFDEGFIEEEMPTTVYYQSYYKVPWPVVEIEAEEPTLVGYPAPIPPAQS
jgi:hypothetical protein